MTARLGNCLIFNPYFWVLGGGERYTLALGSVISETHRVIYAAPNRPDANLAKALGFPPFEVTPLTEAGFPHASAQYDLAVVITLDVPPKSFAARSIAMVQFPRGSPSLGNPIRWLKTRATLRRYHCIVYSSFTREWLLRRWRVHSEVLMPAVELAESSSGPKENLILSVGRFVSRAVDTWNSKRQDVLIEAFSQIPAHLHDSWHLVLVGGAGPSQETDDLLEHLRQQAEGLNVTIEANVSADRLANLQARARMFWHATGFGRQESEPERAEHFGISTVEAMSHGAIPLVYADGGQLEIVTGDFGRLWHSVPELVEQTVALMERPTTDLDRLGEAARVASVRFGVARFEAEARAMLERIGALRAPRGLPGRTLRRSNRDRRRVLGSLSGHTTAWVSRRRARH